MDFIDQFLHSDNKIIYIILGVILFFVGLMLLRKLISIVIFIVIALVLIVVVKASLTPEHKGGGLSSIPQQIESMIDFVVDSIQGAKVFNEKVKNTAKKANKAKEDLKKTIENIRPDEKQEELQDFEKIIKDVDKTVNGKNNKPKKTDEYQSDFEKFIQQLEERARE